MKVSLKNDLVLFFFYFVLIYSCTNSKPKDSVESTDPDFPALQVTKVVDLQRKLNETSGLMNVNGSIWTHNDSGGDEAIYQFNATSGNVEKEVSILNAANIDWEEMFADSTHIYVGNFGNNLGNRKNLSIYRFPKIDMLANEEVSAQEIIFSYPEQTEFPGNYNHNFDAEAMIVIGDVIYLFTKNWQNQMCSLYRLSTEPGSHDATFISSFDTKGVITGATINPNTSEVVLVGYNLTLPQNKFSPFLWKLSDFEKGDFFSGNKKRFNLDVSRQTEAILWQKDNTYLISAENEGLGKATLYSVSLP